MSLTILKATLEGFSGKQKRVFNQSCTSKLYTELNATLTAPEKVIVDDAVDAVDSLSGNDLEDLIVILASDRKLSKRPC